MNSVLLIFPLYEKQDYSFEDLPSWRVAERHSYATHLHETGLDIRYIQELLGHKSSRTTEIYTHVSRRNLIQVRSPIEDMDLK